MSEVQPEMQAALETDAGEAEEWTPSREEFEALQTQLQELAPLREMYQEYQQQEQQAYPEQPQAPLQVDPFADNYADQLNQMIDQRVEQQTASLQGLYQQVQYEQLEEQARDILSDFKQANDIEFGGKGADDWVLAQADKLAPQMAEQYGQGMKAAEAAIAAAANSMHEYEQEIAQAALEQQQNQFTTLSQAPRQPSAAGAAAQSPATPTGGPAAVLAKYYGS